jgi:dinuclear metal center YbgI/SA1388 family protein
MRLEDLAGYLDTYLQVRSIPDSPEALNGLQVANAGAVTRVAAAVDACAATIRMAADATADLLLVHHGLFWGGLRPLTGPAHHRVAALIERNIALYSAHLPLDSHADVGNNPIMARRLGVEIKGTFNVGVWGELKIDRAALVAKIGNLLGNAPRLLPFGPEVVSRVGIITGAGGGEIAAAAAAGLDTYITGEGQHWTYFDAEELGLNVIYAGHYATETFGVQALAEHLSVKFDLPWTFLDHPTGL